MTVEVVCEDSSGLEELADERDEQEQGEQVDGQVQPGDKGSWFTAGQEGHRLKIAGVDADQNDNAKSYESVYKDFFGHFFSTLQVVERLPSAQKPDRQIDAAANGGEQKNQHR